MSNKRTIGLALLLIMLFWFSACMHQSIRDQRAFSAQLKNNPDLQHVELGIDDGVLHAVLMPPLEEAANAGRINSAAVFIHGTPGDWGNAGYYLTDETLRSNAWVVSFDRLGWGRSVLADPRSPAISFESQAIAIAALLEHLRTERNISRIVLVGHSLGASIAPQVAMDFPAQVDAMLLLAGSLDPDLGGPRWFNRLAAIPGVSYILPARLGQSNQEIMALKKNLQLMFDGWGDITIPVTAMQGTEDNLVFPANIDFIEQTLASPPLRSIRLEGAGHLINLAHKPRVVTELTRLLEIVSNE